MFELVVYGFAIFGACVLIYYAVLGFLVAHS